MHGEARRRAGLITAEQFNETALSTAFRYVQFVLRASYLAEYPDPVSLRMPLSRFVRRA